MTEAMQYSERISRWQIYSRYHILSVKCADVWKVWSFLKPTIIYVFQQLPTLSNNYLLHPRISYFTQQLPKSPNNYLRRPKLHYIDQQLRSVPTFTYVNQQLPESPSNCVRHPKITYVAQELPTSSENNITSQTIDSIYTLSDLTYDPTLRHELRQSKPGTGCVIQVYWKFLWFLFLCLSLSLQALVYLFVLPFPVLSLYIVYLY